MISNICFPIFAVGFILILIYSLNFMKKVGKYDIFFILVIIGLIYDTIIVSIGTSIGESNLLYTLNIGRFVIHAVFTPFLLYTGAKLLNSYRSNNNKKEISSLIVWGFIISLILLGVFTHLIGMSIEARLFDGILYYTQSGDHKSFPYASVAVVVIFIGIGIDTMRNSSKKSWFLLAGSIAIFVLSAIPSSIFGIAFGSFGELILVMSIILTFKNQNVTKNIEEK